MKTQRLRMALAALAALSLRAAPAGADGRLPGEVAELTPEVRATAQKHLDVITAKEPVPADVKKATRALLLMGPVVWPAVENASRLTPPESSKPWFNYLRALLVAKAEPDFEVLRDRLRRRILGGGTDSLFQEVSQFRVGRPDPEKPGKRIPLAVKPTKASRADVYRSSDGTIVVAFGDDATDDEPDAPEVVIEDARAGFLAVIGGRAKPYKRQSGRGAEVTARAPMGYAFAWATDGADGVKPGGAGGEAGSAEAKGGAGDFQRSGKGGNGAPG